MSASREETLRAALRSVIDPELGVNVVDLGLVARLDYSDEGVSLWLGATSASCPMAPLMRTQAREALLSVDGVASAEVFPADDDFLWSPDRMSDSARAQLGGAPAASSDLGGSASGEFLTILDQRGGEARASKGGGTARSAPSRNSAPPRNLAWHRLPLLALGMLSLLCAAWAGLVRLGFAWPVANASWIGLHGPLMVCGFLGTLISLERAVGVGRAWAYLAPVLSALGALGLLLGFPPQAVSLLFCASSILLALLFGVHLVKQFDLALAILCLGAVCWFAGNGRWLQGSAFPHLVPWWMLFLVFTIAGERLELTRFLAPSPWALPGFIAGVALTLGGATLAAAGDFRLLGLGFLAMAAWLLVFDIARQTARREGLTRYTAMCLLTGYVWLACAGLFALAFEIPPAGPHYDAFLHAVFLGFAFSMIFGHAPIIFPSVLNRAIAYHPSFYLHLALLHLGLAVRVAGDLLGEASLRQGGALVNAAAILLFLVQTVRSVRAEGSVKAEGSVRAEGSVDKG